MIAIVLTSLLALATAGVLAFDRARSEAARLRLLLEMSGLLQLSGSSDEAAEIIPVFGRRLFAAGALRLRRASGIDDVVVSWGDEHAPAVSIPLHAHGEVAGNVTLQARPDSDFFAYAFADQIALALAQLRQQDLLRTRAVRDALTGLFNRRHIDEALPRMLRENAHVAVLLLDVDYFKAFNDTWGHGAGDALLEQAGRMMQDVFRDEDVVARYGGEEFIVLMPGATMELAQSRAELLRRSIAQLRVHHDGQLLASVTASVGFAIAPIHGRGATELVAAADRALYAAKSAGRDRVCLPPPHIVAA